MLDHRRGLNDDDGPLDVLSGALHWPFEADEPRRFLTQTRPEFMYAGEEEERLFMTLERSDCFDWAAERNKGSIGARLQRSGFLGAPASDESWIFDHIPKTGGSDFNAILQRRVYRHDHLQVRYPASWLGILLGRLERAVIVHGHGARIATQFAPERPWKLAVCVREPIEMAVSNYQQYVRGRVVRSRPAMSLEQWAEHQITIAESGGPDFNRQVRWLGTDRVVSSRLPLGEDPDEAESLDAISERAFERLERYSVIGTPATVRKLFERIARSAQLKIRRDNFPQAPPANASAVPSARLAESLPSDLQEGLRQITKRDLELYERARAHPGWV